MRWNPGLDAAKIGHLINEDILLGAAPHRQIGQQLTILQHARSHIVLGMTGSAAMARKLRDDVGIEERLASVARLRRGYRDAGNAHEQGH